MSAVVQEAMSGVRVVRAYRQEETEMARFRASNTEYLLRNRRLITLQGMFFPSMSFFLGLGALISLWFGSREVITGRITVGQFVAFNSYLTMLSWPVIAFGWVTNMIQRGMASWKRMLQVLGTEPAIQDAVRLTADTTDDREKSPEDKTSPGRTDWRHAAEARAGAASHAGAASRRRWSRMRALNCVGPRTRT